MEGYQCVGRQSVSFLMQDDYVKDNTVFACEHPEGIRSNFTSWNAQCQGCKIAAEASIVLQGDIAIGAYSKTGQYQEQMLGDTYPPDPKHIREAVTRVDY